jgi:hypothetical protein
LFEVEFQVVVPGLDEVTGLPPSQIRLGMAGGLFALARLLSFLAN